MVALAALMMAASPAQADVLNDDDPVFVVFGDDFCDHNPFNDNCDHNRFNDFCGHNPFNDFCDHNRFNDGFGNNNGFFGSDIDQESQSGDVNIGFRVSNSGDFASQWTPATQFGNTGNFQNGSSFVQFGSGTNDRFRDFGFFGHRFFDRGGIDDFEPGGIDVSFGGSQNVSCPSTIEQSSAASS